jgi:hypothetical protein
VIKGLKAALEYLGICSGALAEPLHPLGAAERAAIAREAAALASAVLVGQRDQPLVG